MTGRPQRAQIFTVWHVTVVFVSHFPVKGLTQMIRWNVFVLKCYELVIIQSTNDSFIQLFCDNLVVSINILPAPFL